MLMAEKGSFWITDTRMKFNMAPGGYTEALKCFSGIT